MKGDFSRDTFKPTRRYSAVRMQQGRLQVDADWNEQIDIQNERERVIVRDLLGGSGVFRNEGDPAGDGFSVLPGNTGNTLKVKAGRIYVNGILCENPGDTSFTAQPHRPQAFLSGEAPEDGLYLAYLDAWERNITALEEPRIRELALKGVDTATRTQVVWQIRLMKVTPQSPEDLSIPAHDYQPVEWTGLIGRKRGRLSAKTKSNPAAGDLCSFEARGGYKGTENRLYRVEVHQGGPPGQATYKWSRINGSLVTKWKQMGAPSPDGSEYELIVESTGRDEVLRFAPGHWIEIRDEGMELENTPGTLARVLRVEGDSIHVDADDMLLYNRKAFEDAGETPVLRITDYESGMRRVRRWDSPGATVIPTHGQPMDLEDGVQVRFDHAADMHYEAGDYWLIPARAVTSNIEWDCEGGQPSFHVSPGNAHHFYRLSFLRRVNGLWSPEHAVDCRRVFDGLLYDRPRPPESMAHTHFPASLGEEAKANYPDRDLMEGVRTIQDALDRLFDGKVNTSGDVINGPLEVEGDFIVKGRFLARTKEDIAGGAELGDHDDDRIIFHGRLEANTKQTSGHLEVHDSLHVLENLIVDGANKTETPENGYIARFKGPGDFGVGSDGNPRLFVNATPGFTGIGTSEPEARLHVAGDLKVDANASVTENLAVGAPMAGARLDVQGGDIRSGGGVLWNNGTSELSTDQGGAIKLGDPLADGTTPLIDFRFGTGSPGEYNMRVINSGDGRLAVLGGRLGIGTENPVAPLEVSGEIAVNTAVVIDAAGNWIGNCFELKREGTVMLTVGAKPGNDLPPPRAPGVHSVAMGSGAVSQGVNSFALGDGVLAAGQRALAAGGATRAEGDSSLAAGFGSAALGERSFAAGYYTTAYGNQSAALGYMSSTREFASLALGRYARIGEDTGTLLGVGWGDSIDESQPGDENLVFKVSREGGGYLAGDMGIGTALPEAKLDVAGTIRAHEFVKADGTSIAGAAAGGGRDVPLGTIIAWHKDMTGTPTIPEGWVECNGQVLNDSDSPYDGQTMPNLNSPLNSWNSKGTFLRGATTSGHFETDSFQGHIHQVYHHAGTTTGEFPRNTTGAHGGDQVTPVAQNITSSPVGPPNPTSYGHPRSGAETRPANMSVVWIIKIKHTGDATWTAVPAGINAETGNVGIGKAAPEEKLDVAGIVKAEDFVRADGSPLGGGGGRDVPLGTIIAWHKSLTGTPSIPEGWVECNGQVLTDSDSPYDGQTMPNLNNPANAWNNGGVFLRGNTASGEMQDDTFQGHRHLQGYSGSGGRPGGDYLHNTHTPSSNNGSIGDPVADGANGDPRAGGETRPANMSVVWIIKVKHTGDATWTAVPAGINAETGNVGIGKAAPEEKLDVAGIVKAEDFVRADGTPLGGGGGRDVPLGTIIAWHKSLTGTPSIPEGWVECNGQTLDDPDSPYNGQAMPNLNSPANAWNTKGSFLRGDTTSGDFEDDALQGHWHAVQYSQGTQAGSTYEQYTTSGYNGVPGGTTPFTSSAIFAATNTTTNTADGTPRTDSETRSANMSVVWIMKIKHTGDATWTAVPAGINAETGNVGIGTATPGAKLHVEGERAFFSRAGHTTSIEYSNEINHYLDGAPSPLFLQHRGGSVHMVTGGGNVGIGTDTPSAKLEVAGTIKADNFVKSDGTPIGGGAGNWSVSGSNVYRSTGRVAIGGAPYVFGGTLDVQGTMTVGRPSGKSGRVTIEGDAGWNAALDVQGFSGKNAAIFAIPNGALYSLLSFGTLRTEGFVQQSDIRKKADVSTLRDSLAKLTRLRGVRFRLKESEQAEKYHLGLIAQEVEKEFPELIDVDDKGIKAVDYPGLVSPIVEALKEMNERLAAGSQSRSAGLDYAEFLEAANGQAIPPGVSVVLEGEKIRVAASGEEPIGVISAAPGILGGSFLEWPMKFLRDEFRAPRMETLQEEVMEYDENGELKGTGRFETKTRPKLNPDYDPNREYIPREERPEWNIVGLLGQLPLRKGQPTAPGWIKIKDISADVELWLVK